MSRAADIGSDTAEVLVRISGWSIDDEMTLWFALPAARVGGDSYRLLQPDDGETENWEFSPGEVVRCERRFVSDATYNCWDGCLVAVARAA